MIRLLKEHSLTIRNQFTAEKFQLTLGERDSTATITVGPEAPEISVSDWLQDEDEPGAGIVWRVKSVETDYGTDTRTIQCEHLITMLKDQILFGEVKPGDMAGNPKAQTCTAEQAVRYILGKQSDWKLGSISYSKSAEYNFNGDSLFDALEKVTSSLLDAWWEYDFASYPFALTIRKKRTSASCEMRTDRNIRTMRKTVDRSRMFTRFYPIGKNNLKLGGGGYVQKNTGAYGVICKVETDQSMDTTAKLQAWAEEKLNNHAEPCVTITISGLELSAATGESLDRLTLGTVCRVPLPEFGTVITELITKLSWSDKTADAESVSVTLANRQEDVATIINEMKKSGGGGGRAQAQNEEEDHAWMEDTDDHVGLLADAVGGEGSSTDWSRISSIIVDGEGIHQRVTRTENGLVTAQAAIEVNERSITLEVERATGAESGLSSRITQTADSISLVVEGTGANAHIKPAAIVAAINNGSSSIKISADHITLDGEAVADSLQSQNLQVQQLTVTGEASLDTIDVSQIEATVSMLGDAECDSLEIADSSFTFDGNAVSWKSKTIDTYNFSDFHAFMYRSGETTPTILGKLMTSSGTTTIYYLGR